MAVFCWSEWSWGDIPTHLGVKHNGLYYIVLWINTIYFIVLDLYIHRCLLAVKKDTFVNSPKLRANINEEENKTFEVTSDYAESDSRPVPDWWEFGLDGDWGVSMDMYAAWCGEGGRTSWQENDILKDFSLWHRTNVKMIPAKFHTRISGWNTVWCTLVSVVREIHRC